MTPESNEDVLVNRLVERTASADDLRDLAALAVADDAAWDRAALALRAEAALGRAVESRLAIADRVERRPASRRRALAFANLSGWAAAAAILAATALAPENAAPPASAPVEELPRVILDAKPAPGGGGGYEILFVRRLVERATVPTLFELGTDEHGAPAAAPASAARFRAPESL